MKKRTFISEKQVNYVEDIIVKKYTENLGMSRKEVKQVISDLDQENLFVQAENHLDYHIRAKRLTNLKMHGQVFAYQETTTE